MPVYRSNPEQKIQGAFTEFVIRRGWLVERMHGNAFQHGIPDLYLFHKEYGHRWVDIKNPIRHSLTKAQIQKWHVWEAAGLDIYIITAATEQEYSKLFGPGNFREFWKPRYDRYLEKPENIFEILRNSLDKQPKV